MVDVAALQGFAAGSSIPSTALNPPPSAAQQAAPDFADGMAGGITGLVRAIEADGDPLQIEMRRGLVSSIMSDMLGMNFQLPSSQQLELQQLQGQIAIREQRKKLDTFLVDDVFGHLMDNRERLGIDESIRDNPDSFLAAVGRGKEAGILPDGIEISRSTLVSAGLESALMSPQQRTQQSLSTTTSNIRKSAEVGEVVGAAAEGEGALGQAITAGIEGAEEGSGLNLGTGMLTDIDERHGAQRLAGAFRDLRAQRGDIEGRQVFGAAFLELYGPAIADQLDSLPTDDAGALLFGQGAGDAGVDDEAVWFLATILGQIATDTGQDVGSLMRGIGLNYTGINEESHGAEQARIAAQRADGGSGGS